MKMHIRREEQNITDKREKTNEDQVDSTLTHIYTNHSEDSKC
jgi:hypothetical protein